MKSPFLIPAVSWQTPGKSGPGLALIVLWGQGGLVGLVGLGGLGGECDPVSSEQWHHLPLAASHLLL